MSDFLDVQDYGVMLRHMNVREGRKVFVALGSSQDLGCMAINVYLNQTTLTAISFEAFPVNSTPFVLDLELGDVDLMGLLDSLMCCSGFIGYLGEEVISSRGKIRPLVNARPVQCGLEPQWVKDAFNEGYKYYETRTDEGDCFLFTLNSQPINYLNRMTSDALDMLAGRCEAGPAEAKKLAKLLFFESVRHCFSRHRYSLGSLVKTIFIDKDFANFQHQESGKVVPAG